MHWTSQIKNSVKGFFLLVERLQSYCMNAGPWSVQLCAQTLYTCCDPTRRAAICSPPHRKPTFPKAHTAHIHAACKLTNALQQVPHAASLAGVKYFHTHILLLAPGQKCINQSEMKDKTCFWNNTGCGCFLMNCVCVQQGYKSSPPGSLNHGHNFNKGKPKDKSEWTQKSMKQLFQVVAVVLTSAAVLFLCCSDGWGQQWVIEEDHC